jgi:hypothetical protein
MPEFPYKYSVDHSVRPRNSFLALCCSLRYSNALAVAGIGLVNFYCNIGSLIDPGHTYDHNNNNIHWPLVPKSVVGRKQNLGAALGTIGEPVDTIGEPVDTIGEPVDTIGEPVDTIGEPVDTIGEPVDTIGEPVDTIGELVDTIGELVDTIGEPVGNFELR